MADALDDFALLKQFRAAALSALGAGDYNTAINQALAAQLVLSTMPGHLSRSQGGGGNQSLAWDSESIDRFVVRCRQAQSAGLGVQTANIVYSPPQQTGAQAWQPGGEF
jgi:hypothetical protein